MSFAIGLPNGRKCSITTYCRAWRQLKTLNSDAVIRDWEWFPVKAGDVLRQLREGLHDRINRHSSHFGRGRKWTHDYQVDQRRDARRINEYASRRIVDPINRLSTPELQRRYRWHYDRDGLSINLTGR